MKQKVENAKSVLNENYKNHLLLVIVVGGRVGTQFRL